MSSPSHYRGNYESTHYFFEGQAWQHHGYSFSGSSFWRCQRWLHLAHSFYSCSVSTSSSWTLERLSSLTLGCFPCRGWSWCRANKSWLFRGLRLRVSIRKKADSRFQIWGSFCKEEKFNLNCNKCWIQDSSLCEDLKTHSVILQEHCWLKHGALVSLQNNMALFKKRNSTGLERWLLFPKTQVWFTVPAW